MRSVTYRHNLLECLQCGARALAWLTERFQQCWDRLVDSPCTDVFLKRVECLRSR